MGLKEKYFFEGAQRIGLPLEITKDITQAAFRPQQNAILAPRGVAGKTGDPLKLHFPQAQGCTFCGHCSQGCFEPLGAPINGHRVRQRARRGIGPGQVLPDFR